MKTSAYIFLYVTTCLSISHGAPIEQLLVAKNIQFEESLKVGFECPKHF